MIKPIRPNALIVLEALLAGLPINIGSFNYELIHDPRYDAYTLSCPSYDTDGSQLEYYLPVRMSLGEFVLWCGKATEKEMDVIINNLGLNYAN